MPRIIARTVAVVLWLTPLTWFAWQREWRLLAICAPFSALVAALAVRSARERDSRIVGLR